MSEAIPPVRGRKRRIMGSRNKETGKMIRNIEDAIYAKDGAALERLIANGADVNGLDEDGRTPLMTAILTEHPDMKMIEMLIANGADVNISESVQHWTALHFAARDQSESLVRILLEAGADVDPVDVFGNTPLWRCAMNSNPDHGVVNALLQSGADPNRKNRSGASPVDVAATLGNERLTRLLTGQ